MFSFSKVLLISSIIFSGFSFTEAKKNHPPREGKGERPSFTALDLNSDGGIDFEEFTSKAPPSGDHQAVFLTIDSNDDGVIDEQEFINHKPPHKNTKR